MKISNVLRSLTIIFFLTSLTSGSMLPQKNIMAGPADLFFLLRCDKLNTSSEDILWQMTDNFSNPILRFNPDNGISSFTPCNATNNNTMHGLIHKRSFWKNFISEGFHNFLPWKHCYNFFDCDNSKAVPENTPTKLLSFGAFALIALGFIRRQKKPLD